ncbi:MAG TPA: VOC family protein [Polyangiales bacterium]|nr:VOC family protein [Polyangiales bacterium]
MIAALNHTIVHAKDKHASAAFLAHVLGIEVAPAWGPFVPVQLGNGVTLDYLDSREVHQQHYAFLVDESDFDEIFARIRAANAPYYADPQRSSPRQINHHFGGRGVYFDDPNGHLMEVITQPYGVLPGS